MIQFAKQEQPRKRRMFAAGVILRESGRKRRRELAARLRNLSTVALIRGRLDDAQARLSEAETIEYGLARPLAMDDVLRLMGSE